MRRPEAPGEQAGTWSGGHVSLLPWAGLPLRDGRGAPSGLPVMNYPCPLFIAHKHTVGSRSPYTWGGSLPFTEKIALNVLMV